MRERVHLLGPRKSLLALVHEPEPAPPDSRPTFVILNAGIVHRVGPHRASVRIARELAKAGFRVVRIDFSGLGDSAPRPEPLSFKEATLADITEILDDLSSRYRTKTFVLGGLCAGADRAFDASVRDQRVVGAIMLDGLVYPTIGFYLRHYRHRLARLDGTAALRAAKRTTAALRKRLRGSRETPPQETTVLREIPAHETFERELQALADRGVNMCWVFTAGLPYFHNYEQQFFDSFRRVDFKGRVTHTYFGNSNHTFTQLESQRRLTRHIIQWANATFLTDRSGPAQTRANAPEE